MFPAFSLLLEWKQTPALFPLNLRSKVNLYQIVWFQIFVSLQLNIVLTTVSLETKTFYLSPKIFKVWVMLLSTSIIVHWISTPKTYQVVPQINLYSLDISKPYQLLKQKINEVWIVWSSLPFFALLKQ